MKAAGMCQWKACTSWANVLYESAGLKLLLCDPHWDGVRASLVQTFGTWERACRIVEFGKHEAAAAPARKQRK